MLINISLSSAMYVTGIVFPMGKIMNSDLQRLCNIVPMDPYK